MARYPNIIREGDSLTAEVFCGALYNNKGAWVFAKASPLHDPSGNVIGAIERIRDITERKQAEETFRKISAAVEQSPATIVITDVSGAIEYVNPKFTETTGYTFAEAIGRKFHRPVHPRPEKLPRRHTKRSGTPFLPVMSGAESSTTKEEWRTLLGTGIHLSRKRCPWVSLQLRSRQRGHYGTQGDREGAP